MLAWVRTAIALITFGFGAAKFPDIFRPNVERSNYVLGAPKAGFVMVALAWGRWSSPLLSIGETFASLEHATRANNTLQRLFLPA